MCRMGKLSTRRAALVRLVARDRLPGEPAAVDDLDGSKEGHRLPHRQCDIDECVSHLQQAHPQQKGEHEPRVVSRPKVASRRTIEKCQGGSDDEEAGEPVVEHPTSRMARSAEIGPPALPERVRVKPCM